MDEITHTILPNAGSGWGGTALGAGFGGLIGSWLGNGFGGFGGNRAAAGIKKVIEMEYRELMTATTDKDVETNIYHLSVALLRLWRMHNDRKQH